MATSSTKQYMSATDSAEGVSRPRSWRLTRNGSLLPLDGLQANEIVEARDNMRRAMYLAHRAYHVDRQVMLCRILSLHLLQRFCKLRCKLLECGRVTCVVLDATAAKVDGKAGKVKPKASEAKTKVKA